MMRFEGFVVWTRFGLFTLVTAMLGITFVLGGALAEPASAARPNVPGQLTALLRDESGTPGEAVAAERAHRASLVGTAGSADLNGAASTLHQQLQGLAQSRVAPCGLSQDLQDLCETHTLAGTVFGTPIRAGSFTGTLTHATVIPGPPNVRSCAPFRGSATLTTSGQTEVLLLTWNGISCSGGVPGGGCIVSGRFQIEGATGSLQEFTGSTGRLHGVIAADGRVALNMNQDPP